MTRLLVASLLLHEPAKSDVLTWKEGAPIRREADVILEDAGKTIEARVDIGAQKLEFWKEVSGVQAPITETELDAMNDVVNVILASLQRFVLAESLILPVFGASRFH